MIFFCVKCGIKKFQIYLLRVPYSVGLYFTEEQPQIFGKVNQLKIWKIQLSVFTNWFGTQARISTYWRRISANLNASCKRQKDKKKHFKFTCSCFAETRLTTSLIWFTALFLQILGSSPGNVVSNVVKQHELLTYFNILRLVLELLKYFNILRY